MPAIQDFLTQNRLKRFLVDHASAERRAMNAAYRDVLRLETAPAAEVAAHQQRLLRQLLERAATLPLYRDLPARIGRPVSEARLEDLPRIPFLTKDVLREQGAAGLRMEGASGVFVNWSGGSTGIPVEFWQDDNYKIHMSAATRRSNELAGAFTGARVAKLWGAPQDKRKIEGLPGRIRLWLLNQRYYDTFDMGPERMEQYHAGMERFQPDLIQAYASSVYLMAKYLKSRGIRPTYPRRAIITAAEKLFPHMRELIEEVFAAPVFDRYGSRELSAIASECGCHRGLHVQMSNYIVETVDPRTGEPVMGVSGEIVITALHNHAMPFLRYRIGDMGILDTSLCPCGRTSHRLLEVVGRTSDNFLMPDGRVVHGEYFTHLFYGRDEVEQFQFEQHTPLSYTLRIVPAARFGGEVAEQLEKEVRQMIGSSASLRIELSEQLPKTASGKHRFTISHVDSGQMVGQGESR